MNHTFFRIASIGILLLGSFPFLHPLSAESDLPGKIIARSGRLKTITDRGTLILGLQKDYYPFHNAGANSSKLPGIDIEIAQILADAIGVKLSFKFLPLPELLKAVENGQIDISAGGISSSLERSRLAAFSEPYLVTTPGGLLSKRVLPPESESADFLKERIRGLEDISKLGRLKIGVMKNTRNEDLLKTNDEFSKHKLFSYTDRNKLIEALLKGEIDLLVADAISIQSLKKQNKIPASFIPILGTYREENICLVLPRGDTEIELYLNFFVRSIRSDGRLQNIINKYLK